MPQPPRKSKTKRTSENAIVISAGSERKNNGMDSLECRGLPHPCHMVVMDHHTVHLLHPMDPVPTIRLLPLEWIIMEEAVVEIDFTDTADHTDVHHITTMAMVRLQAILCMVLPTDLLSVQVDPWDLLMGLLDLLMVHLTGHHLVQDPVVQVVMDHLPTGISTNTDSSRTTTMEVVVDTTTAHHPGNMV